MKNVFLMILLVALLTSAGIMAERFKNLSFVILMLPAGLICAYFMKELDFAKLIEWKAMKYDTELWEPDEEQKKEMEDKE